MNINQGDLNVFSSCWIRCDWAQCPTPFSIGNSIGFGRKITGKLPPMKKKVHVCFQFLQATHAYISGWNIYSPAFHICEVLQSTWWSLCEWQQYIFNYPLTTVYSFANEIVWLAQDIHDIVGTNTINFIPKSKIPTGRFVKYGRIEVDYHPQKPEPYQTQLTVCVWGKGQNKLSLGCIHSNHWPQHSQNSLIQQYWQLGQSFLVQM